MYDRFCLPDSSPDEAAGVDETPLYFINARLGSIATLCRYRRVEQDYSMDFQCRAHLCPLPSRCVASLSQMVDGQTALIRAVEGLTGLVGAEEKNTDAVDGIPRRSPR